MTLGHALLVAAAGIVGGAVNAVAGGGTLITFPALLGVGMSAVLANITSSVGLLTGYAGGSVAYRAELAGQGRRAWLLAITSVIGGVAGAAILLVTPSRSFRAAAPFLILASCGLLGIQPWLSRYLDRRWRSAHAPSDQGGGPAGAPARRLGWGAQAGVGIGAVYGSYFGAGLGVLLIAVLALLIDEDLQRLNALKGVLSLIINSVGVVVFLIAGRVAWRYAGILAVTAYLGGTVGVRLARRLSPRVLRIGVLCVGTAVAAVLLATG